MGVAVSSAGLGIWHQRFVTEPSFLLRLLHCSCSGLGEGTSPSARMSTPPMHQLSCGRGLGWGGGRPGMFVAHASGRREDICVRFPPTPAQKSPQLKSEVRSGG